MQSVSWRSVLQVLAIIFMLISIAWYFYDPGFEPLLTFLGGIITGIGSLLAPNGEPQLDKISTATSNNKVITGNKNIQQVTRSGHNLNAPNSKIVAGGDVSIGQWVEPSKEHNAQQIPHEIPSPPPDFTGRIDEIKEILEHFEHGAIIVGIRGLGGIGKTSLAYKLASMLQDHYPDGQLMVDLRGTDSMPLMPSEAMAHIIHAYNPEARLPENESDLSATYRTTLHNKQALLLLDNAYDYHQVRPLLPPSTSHVLVTSRTKFTLPGLKEKDLDTLNPSEAKDLLRAIAGRIGDHANELVQLCGCLPLALRAAGSLLANTPDLDPAEYIEELRAERTRLEGFGSQGVDIGVEASFNLSYGRLSKNTARVFRMLSVFPVDFDARAEEAVCEDEGHRHLSGLVQWSLVDYRSLEGISRYRLHDLARIFAATRLAGDGDKACFKVYLRYAEHYKDVLSDVDDLFRQAGENFLAGLKLFDLEWPNIQAGQAWTENVVRQTDRTGVKKGQVLRLCSSYPDAGAYVLSLRLYPRERIRWLETAFATARLLKDRSAECVHLGNLGIAYYNLSEYNKAIEFMKKPLQSIGRSVTEREKGVFWATWESPITASANTIRL